MQEIILCKYGEIILKGANRTSFEVQLCKELKYRAAHYGNFTITRSQSTVRIEPRDENCDMEGMFDAARKVFGIVAVSRAAAAEKNMESIRAVTMAYIPDFLRDKKTFKVEAKRSDKTFPLSSPEISADIGGVILSSCPWMKVNVHEPDVVIRVEIRDQKAYIHAGQMSAAGGLPVGTNGRGLLLLSGGIDSPVAGFMMAKRGVRIDAIHFESFPYTSEMAREKVLSLARIVAGYAGPINVHIVSLTHIQEELVRTCEEDYFTLLLRRYMMALADRVAKEEGCGALITGESLGQVASQTMQAIGVTDPMTTLPVFRPCIGMDKEEIIQVSRRIGTFDTSIQPYEDCCTVFTPRHPRTKPELAKVQAEEQKLDFAALVEEAYQTKYTVRVRAQY